MKLENEHIYLEISEKGAELIKIQNKKTGKDVLWTGDPKFWGRHSPILFPNVGKTHQDVVKIHGKEYPTKQHGFARDCMFECISKQEDMAVFLLQSNEKTREEYPFDFQLYITYRLVENQIGVEWKVTNPSDETIFFTIGGHPAFMFEQEGKSCADYLIKIPKVEQLICTKAEMGLGVTEPKYTLNLEEEFLTVNEDMLSETIIADGEQIKEAWLYRKKDKSPYIGVKGDGFVSYGIWAPKGAPFICLEPWAGRCDDIGFSGDISEKPGINSVQSGESFTKSYQIIIGC